MDSSGFGKRPASASAPAAHLLAATRFLVLLRPLALAADLRALPALEPSLFVVLPALRIAPLTVFLADEDFFVVAKSHLLRQTGFGVELLESTRARTLPARLARASQTLCQELRFRARAILATAALFGAALQK